MCEHFEQTAESQDYEEAMVRVAVPHWELAKQREAVPLVDDDEFWSSAFGAGDHLG